jgi:hypothetical protein
MKFDVFRFCPENEDPDDENIAPCPEAVKDADNRWVLEFSSLEELMAFAAKYPRGVCLSNKGNDPDGLHILELERP